MGDALKKGVFALSRAGAASVVVHSVGDHKQWHVEFHIIADNLVKNMGIDLDVGGFALNNHHGLTFTCMNHDVGTTVESVPPVRLFDRNQADRVAKYPGKVCDEVLPDPLFRSELYKPLPDSVENLPETILFDDPE